MFKIDITKPTTTRDGRKVRDLHEHEDALWGWPEGADFPKRWSTSGRLQTASGVAYGPMLDLITPVEKKTVNVTVDVWERPDGLLAVRQNCESGCTIVCGSKKLGRTSVEITYTPGEGLEVGDE